MIVIYQTKFFDIKMYYDHNAGSNMLPIEKLMLSQDTLPPYHYCKMLLKIIFLK